MPDGADEAEGVDGREGEAEGGDAEGDDAEVEDVPGVLRRFSLSVFFFFSSLSLSKTPPAREVTLRATT